MALLAVSVDDVISKSTVSGWDIGIAVAVLVLSWLGGRYARRVVLDVAGRLDGVTDDLAQLAGRAAKYFCWLLGFGIALSVLGAEMQPLLAAVLIVGIVTALAIRGVTDNFAAGVVIQTRRPIHIGDEIAAEDYTGIVREMNSRAVVIETFDGRTVHLPNSKILDEPLANHTASGVRRTEVEVRIQHTGPTDGLREALCQAVAPVADVLQDRPVTVTLTARDPERVRLVVRYWHRPDAGLTSTTAVVEAISALLVDRSLEGTVLTPVPPPALTPPSLV